MIYVLKCDDLNWHFFDNFIRLKNLLDKYGFKAGFGFVATRMSCDNPKPYFDLLKQWNEEGFEIWNHGYYHSKEEFRDMDYDYQKKCLIDTNSYLYENTGIKMTTFGSPYNNSNQTTFEVITKEISQFTCTMFASAFDNSNICNLSLEHKLPIEVATSVNDLDLFVKEHNSFPYKDYGVIQTHPAKWDEKSFLVYEDVLKIIKENGGEVLTPSQCVGRI